MTIQNTLIPLVEVLSLKEKIAEDNKAARVTLTVLQLTSEPEDIHYERYRLSEGIRYLIVLVGPYVGNATKRSRALTVAQCVCVSLRFFGKGTYLHTENISKNTVCLAIRKVVAALNTLLNTVCLWCFPAFCQHKLSSCKLSTCG
ncbi:hypothetical protein N1851_010753 [Merluccius polli]|uniref:Uncharacterized protein n=1 Tax=Merluccius polli TaxID=89951 RepID=A0AA47MY85_MERPO|nr:hypothetical protein N1851_010753 [Merluccius polli]